MEELREVPVPLMRFDSWGQRDMLRHFQNHEFMDDHPRTGACQFGCKRTGKTVMVKMFVEPAPAGCW